MNATDYRCGNCGKRYRRPDPSWSCCVLHSPGECCHFGEVRITKHGKPKDRHGSARHPMVIRVATLPFGTSSTVSNPWCASCGGWHPATALCGNTTIAPWVLS